jgi:hypothetical protein
MHNAARIESENAIAIPASACLGCGSTTVELTDGYCDETDGCHALGVAAERERREAREECETDRDQYACVCVCGEHKEVA